MKGQYASKYYDPVKAHLYYMAHRVLKGRRKKTTQELKSSAASSIASGDTSTATRSITKFNENGKATIRRAKVMLKDEFNSYKNQCKNMYMKIADALRKGRKQKNDSAKKERDKAVKKAQDARDKQIEAAKKARDDANAQLKKGMESTISSIRQRLKDKSLTPEQKEALRDEISLAREDYKAEKADNQTEFAEKRTIARDEYKGVKDGLQEDYRQTKANNQAECKEKIDTARTNYKNEVEKARKDMNDQYNKLYDDMLADPAYQKPVKQKKLKKK